MILLLNTTKKERGDAEICSIQFQLLNQMTIFYTVYVNIYICLHRTSVFASFWTSRLAFISLTTWFSDFSLHKFLSVNCKKPKKYKLTYCVMAFI